MTGTKIEDARRASGIPGLGNSVAANRLVLLVAVPLFLVMALVAYFTVQFAINERTAQGWVRHTYEVLERPAPCRATCRSLNPASAAI